MAAVAVVAVVAGLAVLSLCVGALSTGPGETFRILGDWMHGHGFSAVPTDKETAVLHYRVPRTCVIVIAGIGLGLAGTLIQGHTRNPLADPGLLGISAGAALAIVVGIWFLGVDSVLGHVLLAFAGAAVAATAVFAIGGTGRRGDDPVGLVLAGAAVSALFGALTTTIILRSSQALDTFRHWTSGSVAWVDTGLLLPAAIPLVIGTVVAFASAPGLNLLTMGSEAATSLGLNVPRLRVAGLIAVTVLAGAATAVAGPLAFLGLTAPHIARGLVGADYRLILPMAAACGTAILFVADIIGRVVADREIPAGVMLVFVGVPFFLIVVRRTRFRAVA